MAHKQYKALVTAEQKELNNWRRTGWILAALYVIWVTVLVLHHIN